MAALLLVLGVVPAADGLAAAPHAVSARITGATGTVTKLDLTRITVNRVTCSLGRKGAALAGSFAVGENVTIGCARNVLQTIKFAPVTSGAGHAVPVLQSSSALTPRSAGSSKVSLSWSGGTISLGGTRADSSPAVSVSATGQITSLDPTGITVGDVTCPFFATNLSPAQQAVADKLSTAPYGVYQILTQRDIDVGSTATISCTYSNGSSSGRIVAG